MANFDQSMMKFLIGRSRIKYAVLDELFRTIYIPQDKVVFHVDASAILYRLYRNKDLDMIYSVDQDIAIRDLVISFLNVLAHYRRYLVTRLHKTNDILVYFNHKEPGYQRILFSNYRKEWYDGLKNQMNFGPLNHIIEEGFRFIQGLIPYFEGIYMVNGDGVDDFTAMYHTIHSKYYGNEKNWYHIIFSRNMLSTQMVDGHCCQLYNKRDDSYIIDLNTVYKNGILKGRKTAASDHMTAKFLPFIWTLGGCTDISLKKSKYMNGVADAVKSLNPIVDHRALTDDMSIQAFIKALSNYIEPSAELRLVPTDLINRYRMLDLSLSAAAITEDQKIKIWKNHFDLYDQTGLEEINDHLSNMGENADLLEITNLNMSTCYDNKYNPFDEFNSGGFSDFYNLGFSI